MPISLAQGLNSDAPFHGADLQRRTWLRHGDDSVAL